MTTQTKRKRSYGLISRLVVIAAFVGLGSWAVFNSKFRKPDHQIAKVESDNQSEEGDDEKADEKSNTDLPSNSDPQGSPESNPKNDDLKNTGPPNSSSFSPTSTPNTTPPATVPKSGSGNSAFKNKIVGNIDDRPSDTSANSFLSKFGNNTPSKPVKQTPVDDSVVQPASLKISDDSKNKIKSTAKTVSAPPSTTPPTTKAPETGPPSTAPPSSFPGVNLASESNQPKSGFTPPSMTFNPNSAGGAFSGDASSKNSGPAKRTGPDSTPPKRLISESSTSPPSAFNPNPPSGSKPFDPTGGGALTNKSSGSAPPSQSQFSASNNFKEVKEEKPLRPTKPELKSGPPKSDQPNSFASNSSQSGGFDPSKTSPPKSPSQFGGTTFNGSSSTGASGPAPSNSNSGGGFSLSPNPTSSTAGTSIQPNSTSNLANNATPPSIPRQNRTGPAFSETEVNKSASKPNQPSPPGNRILVRPIASNDNSTPGKSSGSAYGSRPKADPSQTGASRPANSAQNGSNPKSSGNRSQNSFASSAKQISSNPNLVANPTIGVGDNKPGPNSLEGTQTPAITIRKIAPPEVQLNVEATFKIIVKNVGKVPATHVTIVDPIPVGTEFISSNPRHNDTGTDGSLIWKFGSLAPNETKVIDVNLRPIAQGEIGSVARMSFQAAASAKTVCTKPVLEITQRGPEKVLIGQNAQFQINVKNTGDGRAMNVSIQEIVPKGFAFADIRDDTLIYEIGNLGPNQSRNVNLTLRAVTPGKYACKIDARMGKTLAGSKVHNIEIVAPVLSMNINGPERRYIQREAKYNIDLENTGTAVAQNVTMITYLPKGMRFMSTNNRGQYVQRQHAVYWSIATLAPGNKGSVELRLMPVGTGQQEIRYEARSILAKTELNKHPVLIDQLAELFFEVDDRDDPIEVNGETEYRVRVVNQGTKMATNVSVIAEMPAGINAFNGSGPTQPTIAGRMVSFAPIAQLAPDGVAIFKIQAKGVSDGDHKIKISLSSNERRESVAKEESTKVYSSQIR